MLGQAGGYDHLPNPLPMIASSSSPLGESRRSLETSVPFF